MKLDSFLNTALIFGMSYQTMEKRQIAFNILKELFSEVEVEKNG